MSIVLSGSLILTGSISASGNLTTLGTITAQTLVVQTITSSIVNMTGSNRFGGQLTDRQTFTGSVVMTGSLTVNTTGTEFQVTNNGVVIGNLLTDNHTMTGSVNITGSLTGSLFGTSSQAVSSSYALTASFALTAGGASGFPFTGSASITGSFRVSGSTNISASSYALQLLGSGSSVFSVDGTVGRLFEVDDSLSGSLFSVNTAAGLPVIEAFSDNTVRIGQFGQRALFVSQSRVGIGTENPSTNLHISGSSSRVALITTNGALSTGFYDAFQILAANQTGGGLSLNVGKAESNNNLAKMVYFHSSDGSTSNRLGFGFYGADGLVNILASGNVGIGTTSPTSKFFLLGAGSYNTTTSEILTSDATIFSSEMSNDAYNSILQLVSVRQSLSTGASSNGFLGFSTIDDSNGEGIRDAGRIAIVNETAAARNSATALSFWTNTGGTKTTAATERMRITSGGKLLIGTTSAGYGLFTEQRMTLNPTNDGITVAPLTQNKSAYTLQADNNTGNRYAVYVANGSSAEVGSMSFTSTAVAFNTTSDYRLKQDFKDFKGLDLISSIKTYDFEWKINGSRSYGVIAHELQEVIPYVVINEKDGSKFQSVDYSKLVPVLTKAIQELEARVKELENK
jgi:hypothetical protein